MLLLLSELLGVDGYALRDVVGLVDANQAVGELEHVVAEAFLLGRGSGGSGYRQKEGEINPSRRGNPGYDEDKRWDFRHPRHNGALAKRQAAPQSALLRLHQRTRHVRRHKSLKNKNSFVPLFCTEGTSQRCEYIQIVPHPTTKERPETPKAHIHTCMLPSSFINTMIIVNICVKYCLFLNL